ncbi:MAG: exosome complex protein Rrp42 [Candidatus Diapherotrites archaeon]|nr:exosome complex protein Rrp42 [Candidatus Diapherotrites archaeon]
MNEIIWDLIKDKTIDELKKGIREDGRSLDQYRPIKIEYGITKNADGSASVKLGNTFVLAGVKFGLGEPYPDSPNEGAISVGTELLAMASPSFDVGPPDENAIELARVVDRGIRESKAIDFNSLCIREGELVWIIYLDLYVLNDDGNLFDASALAALSALKNSKFPKMENDKIVLKESTNIPLNLKRLPILNTFTKVEDLLLVDASLKEEKASDGRFSVCVTEDGFMTAFQKGGIGSFKKDEIDRCIDLAFKNAELLRKLL